MIYSNFIFRSESKTSTCDILLLRTDKIHSWLRSVGLCSSNSKPYARGCNPGHFLLPIPTMLPQELQKLLHSRCSLNLQSFSVSFCRTPGTTNYFSCLILSPNILPERGRPELTTLKTNGHTNVSQGLSKLLYPRTSHFKPFLSHSQFSPDAVWPTVDVFSCQSQSSQHIQSKSRISLPLASASSEHNIPHQGFRWTHPHAYSCITHYFSKTQKFL